MAAAASPKVRFSKHDEVEDAHQSPTSSTPPMSYKTMTARPRASSIKRSSVSEAAAAAAASPTKSNFLTVPGAMATPSPSTAAASPPARPALTDFLSIPGSEPAPKKGPLGQTRERRGGLMADHADADAMQQARYDEEAERETPPPPPELHAAMWDEYSDMLGNNNTSAASPGGSSSNFGKRRNSVSGGFPQEDEEPSSSFLLPSQKAIKPMAALLKITNVGKSYSKKLHNLAGRVVFFRPYVKRKTGGGSYVDRVIFVSLNGVLHICDKQAVPKRSVSLASVHSVMIDDTDIIFLFDSSTEHDLYLRFDTQDEKHLPSVKHFVTVIRHYNPEASIAKGVHGGLGTLEKNLSKPIAFKPPSRIGVLSSPSRSPSTPFASATAEGASPTTPARVETDANYIPPTRQGMLSFMLPGDGHEETAPDVVDDEEAFDRQPSLSRVPSFDSEQFRQVYTRRTSSARMFHDVSSTREMNLIGRVAGDGSAESTATLGRRNSAVSLLGMSQGEQSLGTMSDIIPYGEASEDELFSTMKLEDPYGTDATRDPAVPYSADPLVIPPMAFFPPPQFPGMVQPGNDQAFPARGAYCASTKPASGIGAPPPAPARQYPRAQEILTGDFTYSSAQLAKHRTEGFAQHLALSGLIIEICRRSTYRNHGMPMKEKPLLTATARRQPKNVIAFI